MTIVILLAVVLVACDSGDTGIATSETPFIPAATESARTGTCPRIASWLAKKDEIIASGKPYSLVMSGYFEPTEAEQLRNANPNVLLLAGLTVNWVWENPDWKQFLLTVAGAGQHESLEIDDTMYLRDADGSRCAFGWASEEWGHEEIYAMKPQNPDWISLITSFYKTTLQLAQHDGIIVDMVTEQSWCPEAISSAQWVSATRDILQRIDRLNTEDKPVIFNAGKAYDEIDAYAEYMDGYLMENFLGEWGADYRTGLEAANSDYMIVYAVDTDDTGIKDLNRMRLGLTLSLLNNNTYFTYDFGPRDHGQAWWFPEYDVELGNPLGDYYQKDNSYRRDFEFGTVVSAPYSETSISFHTIHKDATSDIRAETFRVQKGDGRIFLKVYGNKEIK